jgi:hypothetical protein
VRLKWNCYRGLTRAEVDLMYAVQDPLTTLKMVLQWVQRRVQETSEEDGVGQVVRGDSEY